MDNSTTPTFDTLNRSGLSMLAETAIAAAGGADSMYGNDPGKLRLTNKWVDHARPIIKAMFLLDDAADQLLVEALCATHRSIHHTAPETWQERNYREARAEVAGAGRALYDMLDGIRDNFICDECCGVGDTDDETEAADAYNDWLRAETITVDQAIRIVTDEHNAGFDRSNA